MPWNFILPLLEMFSVFVMDINGNPVSPGNINTLPCSSMENEDIMYFRLGVRNIQKGYDSCAEPVRDELQIICNFDFALGKEDIVRFFKIAKIAVI